MHVLYLTQWYPPEPAILQQQLAQTLIERGHHVTILTGFPNYPAGKLYPGYRIKPVQREVLAGVPVVRVPLFPEHSRSALLRIGNYLSFALSAGLLGAGVVSRPDVLFVYHPPLSVGLPAIALSRIWKVPFVYQIQDLWPDTLKSTGMVNNETVLDVVGSVAAMIYREAAAIPVISEGFRQRLLEQGVPASKLHVISNWVDHVLYHPESPDAALAERLGLAGRFNVMFAGNLGAAQGLETVIEAARLLRGTPGIQFVFVGDGVAEQELRSRVRQSELSNVLFLGRYSHEGMNKLYALADALLVHLRNDPLFEITVPHKIFSYMAVGKPILCAVGGEAAHTVVNTGAGVACPPQAAERLAETVQMLYAMPEDQRIGMGRCGLQAARTIYSREYCISQLEALFYDVMQARLH